MPVFSRHFISQLPAVPNGHILQSVGPRLPVVISVPAGIAAALTAAGQPIPSPRAGDALIDTGASITSVEVLDLQALNLQPVNQVPIFTPGQSAPTTHLIYPCQMEFPGTPIPPLQMNAVIGGHLRAQGIIALIGRDILRSCQLVYNGVDGFWTLAF